MHPFYIEDGVIDINGNFYPERKKMFEIIDNDPFGIGQPAIIGEQVAGRSSVVRKDLEQFLSNISRNTFDVAELLHEVKSKQYYSSFGFETFTDYVKTLDIKPRKSQYLVSIVEVMSAVNIQRVDFQPLGIAKLREISSLDPKETYTEPATGVQTPMVECIRGLVAEAPKMSLTEVKEAVKALKGLVGEDELVWCNFSVKKIVKESIILPGLEKAKSSLGSYGRDTDGNAVDSSDGAALEVVFVEFLNTEV